MNRPDPSPLDERDLIALLEAANRLNQADTLEDVLGHFLELGESLTESEAGSVILHSQAHNDLYFAAATGPVKDELKGVRIPKGKGKAWTVFSTRAPLIDNKLEGHYGNVDEKTRFRSVSMICVPLLFQDTTYGVMQLLNKGGGQKPYSQRDLELLQRLATQASIAIRNARLFEMLLASSGLHARPEVRKDLISRVVGGTSSSMRERFTILHADMRAFTHLCNMLPQPEKIQSILSDYHLMMASVIVGHDGIVNKVMGDGLMALFRSADGATQAVKAALEILDGFDRLRTTWNELTSVNLGFLDVGIAIATGDEMILGTIGDDNFRDFSIIGTAANLAGALVKQARGGKRLLCDKLTYRAIKDKKIAVAEAPETFTIDKPGPLVGVSYDVYHLRSPATVQKAAAPAASYDAFFSYRREDGSYAARSVQQALKEEISIFLDVDELPSGEFDTALLSTIESAPNFVVFLTRGSLERCADPQDWFGREIRHALETRRNIVPLTLPGFDFPKPEALPLEIRDLVRHDAVEFNHRYFYAMLDKLRGHLRLPGAGG